LKPLVNNSANGLTLNWANQYPHSYFLDKAEL
jgi:hypothetical protein